MQLLLVERENALSTLDVNVVFVLSAFLCRSARWVAQLYVRPVPWKRCQFSSTTSSSPSLFSLPFFLNLQILNSHARRTASFFIEKKKTSIVIDIVMRRMDQFNFYFLAKNKLVLERK